MRNKQNQQMGTPRRMGQGRDGGMAGEERHRRGVQTLGSRRDRQQRMGHRKGWLDGMVPGGKSRGAQRHSGK